MLDQSLLSQYDVVGFDPRGVGESAPVHCYSSRALDYLMATTPHPERTPREELINGEKALALSCQRNSGKSFGFVDTVSAARDMDLIRVALGDDKITYFGFSYGTFLGQVVDRMSAMPSVRSAAVVSDAPLGDSPPYVAFSVQGQPASPAGTENPQTVLLARFGRKR